MNRPNGPKFSNQTFLRFEDIDDETKLKIVEMTENGCSHTEIMKALSVSIRTVRRVQNDNSLKTQFSARRVSNEKYDDFIKYAKNVRRLSKVIRRYLNLDYVSGYEWDHKVSIVDCFINKVRIDIAASRENMELIPSKENISKHSDSSITIEELDNLYIKERKIELNR